MGEPALQQLRTNQPLAETIEAQVGTCERLVELLREQREAVLGKQEEAVWRSTAQIGQELQKLERLGEQRRELQSHGAAGAAQLRRGLEQIHARMRLEAEVSQEILTDLLAYIEFVAQQVGSGGPGCYDPQGNRPAGEATGMRFDQEV